jgi:hypothetical protein
METIVKQYKKGFRDFEGVDLKEADLEGANLSWANLKRARLSHADLYEANLSWANLKKANLVAANLVGANLEGVDLEGTCLEGSNLEGAKGIYAAGPMPTSGRIIYFVQHKDKIMVRAGCFWGDIDTLREKVEATHKCPVYLANIELVKKMWAKES